MGSFDFSTLKSDGFKYLKKQNTLGAYTVLLLISMQLMHLNGLERDMQESKNVSILMLGYIV